MAIRLFLQKKTQQECTPEEAKRKDTDGIKAEGVYGNGNGNA